MRRVSISALAMCLAVKGMAVTAGTEALTFDQETRDALHGEIRDYLLSNPDIILEMLRIIEERRNQAEEDRDRQLFAAYREQITDDGVSFVGGNPDGDVTLVEFLDYRCGYCRRAHPEIARLLEEDGNIKWIIKEYPILGPESVFAAKMAVGTLLSLGGDAYETLHDTLMTYPGPINRASLEVIAGQSGLDPLAVETAMQDPQVDSHIRSIRELGRALGVSGTPTFIVGETFVRGFVPKADLQRLVDATRAGEL